MAEEITGREQNICGGAADGVIQVGRRMILFILVFLASGLATWIFNDVDLAAWRRTAGTHWTVRARALFPARVSRQINLWVIPGVCMLLTHRLCPEISWALVGMVSFLGAVLGNFPMDRATIEGLRFWPWCHVVFGTLFLRFSSWATYLAAAFLMPGTWGWLVLMVAVGFVALQVALQFGLNVRIMGALGLLKPASVHLQSLVNETSGSMGVNVRATWELAGAQANAVAFVTTRELAFTGRLLATTPDDEIKAICAHELGHLMEGRWTVVGRIAGSLVFFPVIFFRPAYAEWEETAAAVIVFASVGLWVAVPRWLRYLEKRADRIARDHTVEIGVYARALERIYRANQMPAVQRKNFALTHPDLYDRMLAAGLTPDYARPEVPAEQGWTSKLTMVILGLTVVGVFVL